MTHARIYGVDVCIDRDPNAGLYYIYLQYRGKKELPILLGNFIEPEKVYGVINAFLEENRVRCRPKTVKDRIANLLQNTFSKMGTEDEKTLDLKFFKWTRTHPK